MCRQPWRARTGLCQANNAAPPGVTAWLAGKEPVKSARRLAADRCGCSARNQARQGNAAWRFGHCLEYARSAAARPDGTPDGAAPGAVSGTVFLQNAETIRLVRPDGKPVSVVELKPGDAVLCRVDVAGRHFGMRITENIQEG